VMSQELYHLLLWVPMSSNASGKDQQIGIAKGFALVWTCFDPRWPVGTTLAMIAWSDARIAPPPPFFPCSSGRGLWDPG
jgi:hypothetical protein